jgi:hypothetical protein
MEGDRILCGLSELFKQGHDGLGVARHKKETRHQPSAMGFVVRRFAL